MTEKSIAAVAAAAAAGMAEAPEAAAAAEQIETTVAPPAPQPTPVAAAAPDLDAVRREAAAAERKRIAALDALALPGCEAIIAAAKEDGAGVEATALLMVQQIKSSGALDAVAAMAKGAATVPALPDAAHDPIGAAAQGAAPAAATPEAWAAEWSASAKLQAEFKTSTSYVAFKKAEASGRARILNPQES